MREAASETTLAVLDDRATVARLDPHGLLARIEALPEQCADGWRRARDLLLSAAYGDAEDVVVLGMGGSAIAGDILRSLASVSAAKPVHVVRGYDLPPFVGKSTLVVACSHSGNTEETLSAFEQALAKGACCFAITTGGGLRELAESHGVPTLIYEYAGEPRSALGHQLMALLALGERVGVLEPPGAAVDEAVALMQGQRQRLGFAVASIANEAKQLAGRLYGRLPVVIGAGVLSEAAHRWKTQLNENSKAWAIWEELPEMDHNTIEGAGLAKEIVPRLHAVFLWHAALHPRVRLRYDVTAEELTAVGVSHERVEALGASPLAQVLTAIYHGDLASYYLGLLNDVQPSPVPILQRLKEKLTDRR